MGGDLCYVLLFLSAWRLLPVCFSCSSDEYQAGSICHLCDPSCKTCIGSGPTHCSECRDGMSQWHWKGQAKGRCYDHSLTCTGLCEGCITLSPSECLSCKQNASLQEDLPAACECNDGYSLSADSSQCVQCDSACSKCSIADIHICAQCVANASMSDSNPNHCNCNLGFFLNPTSNACDVCDASCTACTHTSCSTCHSASASPSPTRPVCDCADGYYPDPTPQNCSQCSLPCKRCNSFGDDQCLECFPPATIASTSPNTCSCPSDHYLDRATGQCALCDRSCATCLLGTEYGCSSCNGYSDLAGLPPAACVCRLGMFLIESTKVCSPCSPTCSSCLDETSQKCTGCKENAVLSCDLGSPCKCNIGFYPSPTVADCKACVDSCSVCRTADVCIVCDAGFFLSDTKCVQCAEGCSQCVTLEKCTACISPYALTLTSKCVSCPNCGEPLRASVTSLSDHTYEVSFNRQVVTQISDSSLRLATSPPSEISFTILSQSPLILSINGGPWDPSTRVIIEFLSPNSVFDQYGNPLTTAEFELSPPLNSTYEITPSPSPSPDVPPPSTTVANTLSPSVSTTVQQTTTVVAAAAVVGGAVLGSASLSIGLLGQIQYLSFISQTGTQLPGGTDQCYSNMSQKSALPNFFASSGKPTQRKLSNTDDLVDFLDESGSFISILSLMIGVHMTIRIAALLWRQRKFPRVLRVILSKFEWSFYLYFISFSYLDLTVGALRQLNEASISSLSFRTWANLLLSFSVICVLLVFPIFLWRLIKSKYSLLFASNETSAEQTIKGKWLPVVKNLRTDVPLAAYYHPAIYAQRFLYGLFLVFLSPGKWLCLAVIFPSLWITVFVLFARPMVMPALRWLLIISEVQTLLLFLVLFTLQMASTQFSVLSWAVIVLTIGSLSSLVAMMVISMVRTFVGLFSSRKSSAIHPKLSQVENLDTTLEFHKDEEAIHSIPGKALRAFFPLQTAAKGAADFQPSGNRVDFGVSPSYFLPPKANK